MGARAADAVDFVMSAVLEVSNGLGVIHTGPVDEVGDDVRVTPVDFVTAAVLEVAGADALGMIRVGQVAEVGVARATDAVDLVTSAVPEVGADARYWSAIPTRRRAFVAPP